MADNEVKLTITAEDNATGTIKKIIEALGETGLGQAVTAASTGFLAIKGAADIAIEGFKKIASAVGTVVNAAAEAEASQQKLITSLKMTGQFSQAAVKDINAFASGLQASTGTSDEMVQGLISQATAMGMSIEQAKKATKAAIDYAAATGGQPVDALNKFQAASRGMIKGLINNVDGIQNLTKAQLANGAAIDLVAGKFKGFAEAQANTFAKSIEIAEGAFSDLLEEIGMLITQNPVVIDGIKKSAELFLVAAANVKKFADFVQLNWTEITEWAKALGIATLAIGALAIGLKVGAIGFGAMAIATKAWTMAMLSSPIGPIVLAIGLLTVAIKLAIDNWELFSGTIKNWAGSIIQWAMPAIKLMLQGLAELVGVFSDDLEAKINQSITDIDNFSKQLVISGEAQVKAAEAAELHAESEAKVSEEMQKSANAAEEQQQQLIRLKTEYNQLSIGAERAFDSVKEFTPRINLNKFLQDAESYKESLNKLMSKGVELAAADPSQRARILQDNADTAEAIKAFNLKIAQEERNAKVKEVEIGLQLQRQAIIGEEEQIALLKIQKAQELRSQLVQIKTQQLMEEREIQQNALSVDQEAQLAARNKELENYRTSLEFEKTMAVDIELQKQAELAAIKAQATQGLGGSAEAGGGAKQAIVQEQMRQAELTRQVKAGEIERADFERAMDASRANERKAANAEELALAQERTALLGQHELAFREQQKIAEAAYKEQLKVIEETESIQGEEKKIAREEAEMNHLANMQSIREQNLQQEIARNEKLGNSWDATLSRIKLAQLQHGKAMGFLIAWQASRENQAIQSGLSAGSELMQSEHKKQFEIGKAAAIAQTTMNTAMAAVMAFTALAGIPIVGPALAFSMAALITAAGLMRLQQIRNTQFKGGQADEGMTEIPQSMHGKSFVMAGGERVIKTNQNKDLTSALERINSGETQNNNNISITVNGNANEDTVRDMRDTIVQILRDQSDRGRPIMNERGLVR